MSGRVLYYSRGIDRMTNGLLSQIFLSDGDRKTPHKAVYSQAFEQIGWSKYTMNILAAHLNTSSATEMLFTILELADIGC